ncbi:MAG: DUF3365 domain-containing protein [Sneathiella sp.]|nr:DUF3365 domain-containing protein [Sneathiella sp.]
MPINEENAMLYSVRPLLNCLRLMFFSCLLAMVLNMAPITVSFGATAATNEEIALNLATLLRSARAVISDNQKKINDASLGDKGLTANVVVTIAKENFKKATGKDIEPLLSDGLQGELLTSELAAIGSVMDDAQAVINQQGVGLKGFLPAIFARQVTEKFRQNSGGKADLKLTAPKNYVRNRANRPDKWEHSVIENQFKSASYTKGQAYSENTQKKGKPAFRLMIPEYYKQSCLACHGEPKGARDITGGKKEGGVLGELGGSISVSIFQ